jgi:hypothetical protein
MATGTQERRTTTAPPRTTTARTDTGAVERPRRTMAIPRSRGFVGGFILLLLGIWGGLIPFVGPYFGYELGSDQTWAMSWNRFWLDVLPAAALVLGGLMLMFTRNRISGILGGWIALCGGAWFVVGPTVAMLWDGAAGANPIGPPAGSNGVEVLELLGYFYALGALAIALAGMALGRMSVVGVRDIEAAETRRDYEPVADAPRDHEPVTDDGVAGAEAPPRRRRLFRRTR